MFAHMSLIFDFSGSSMIEEEGCSCQVLSEYKAELCGAECKIGY